jgi:hypothetical protein
VTPGLTGQLPVTESGLAPAETARGTVAVDAVDFYCATVPADTRAFRAQLDSAQDDADLDLFLLTSDAACEEAGEIVDVSGSTAADEQLTLDQLPAGNYLVAVSGFSDGEDADGRMAYRLDVFNVLSGKGVGNLRAQPDPVPVTQGQEATFDVLWSGLARGTRYFGVLDYGDIGGDATYVAVDTTS